jgi:hypothetical protein
MTALQLQILAVCAGQRMKRKEIQAALQTPVYLKELLSDLYASGHLGGTRGLHSTTTMGMRLLREAT